MTTRAHNSDSSHSEKGKSSAYKMHYIRGISFYVIVSVKVCQSIWKHYDVRVGTPQLLTVLVTILNQINVKQFEV